MKKYCHWLRGNPWRLYRAKHFHKMDPWWYRFSKLMLTWVMMKSVDTSVMIQTSCKVAVLTPWAAYRCSTAVHSLVTALLHSSTCMHPQCFCWQWHLCTTPSDVSQKVSCGDCRSYTQLGYRYTIVTWASSAQLVNTNLHHNQVTGTSRKNHYLNCYTSQVSVNRTLQWPWLLQYVAMSIMVMSLW